MTYEEIKLYCLAKAGAYQDCPFGPFPVCFKVGRRIFLEWYPDDGKITVRCEPLLSDFYRRSYPDIVVPGYHCPDRIRQYKNTVYVNNGLDDALIFIMIDHSYEEAVKRLKKNESKEVISLDNNQ